MDLSEIESRPIVDLRMEISIANEFSEPGFDGNCNLVELDNLINDLDRI